MDSIPASPPKGQRNYSQESLNSDENSYIPKSVKSRKQKLFLDQENFDSSNYDSQVSIRKLGFFPTKSPIQCSLVSKFSLGKTNQTNFSSLPFYIQFEVFKYLSPHDLIKSVQFTSRSWYKLSNDKRLWTILDKFQKLSVDLKYVKKQCLVERRSKGKLFKATSKLDDDKVMIRKIHLSVANAGFDDGVPTSVLREISYLSNLSHLNISQIKEVEVSKEHIQICSEFQDYSLKEYMKLHLFKQEAKGKNTPPSFNLPLSEIKTMLTEYKMPLRNIKLITYQILKGLCFLHHQGIIHRNLKPDNIFINTNDEIKIGDFSLSRLISIPHIPYTPEDPKERERSGREARRLWYRAPELLLRKNIYSFEVDIWAFGCLLAELAANEPLFNGDSEIEQLFKIFRMVGSPNVNNWDAISDNTEFQIGFPDWKPVYFPYVCESKDSEEFDYIQKLMVPNREKAFKKLGSLANVLGVEGLDLLWNCLLLDPKMRPNASTLLTHAFFDDVREESEVKYMGIVCCQSQHCENSGTYTIPNMLDCHLISYFNSLKKIEGESRPCPNYFTQQPVITDYMRTILVDWLIDVSVHFEVSSDTLHYCVNSIDRVLSKLKIDKSKLQLIGVTCMKLADVCHERSKEYYKQENALEYANITADEYTATQLIEMEKVILNVLGFKLNTPTAMHFLKVYVALFQIPDQVAVVAMFIVDLMLLSHEILEFNYSLIASSALFLACQSIEHKIDSEKMEVYRSYIDIWTQNEFKQCVAAIKRIWNAFKTTPSHMNFEAIYNKYKLQFQFFGRMLVPPSYSYQDLEEWFYTAQKF